MNTALNAKITFEREATSCYLATAYDADDNVIALWMPVKRSKNLGWSCWYRGMTGYGSTREAAVTALLDAYLTAAN